MSQFENDWANYAYSTLHHDIGCREPNTATASPLKKDTNILDFERNEYDLPVLLPLKDNIKTDEINAMIQSFLLIHYSECCDLFQTYLIRAPFRKINSKTKW